jgi:hypothetical protein
MCIVKDDFCQGVWADTSTSGAKLTEWINYEMRETTRKEGSHTIAFKQI